MTMDRRQPDAPRARVALKFEGRDVPAAPGETVAVALFASGERVLSRSIKYHRPRGFFCLESHCGACLMRIDGKPNMKACKTPVRDGLVVERQNAWPSGGFDVLAAADIFFPKGMDHHTMFTSPRALNAVMQKVVRQLGGLGRLPDAPVRPRTLAAPRARHVDVAIVGGGPAGLACAEACARAGRSVVVVDEQDRAGGSYLAHPGLGPQAADRAIAAARAAGADVLEGATAIAWYPEDAPREGAPPGLLAVATGGDGLLKLTAERYVYATGGYDQNLVFANNDRPGVLSGRAVGRLLVRFGVRPGERPVVAGDGEYADALAAALAASGAQVARVAAATKLVAAHGHSWVRSLEVEGGRRIKCDVIAACAPPAPASELPRQHGVAVELRGGFACVADADGRTQVARVFTCGDVAGYVGPRAAAAAGARCGDAVARSLA
jgi:NADPH-dependent 2,4-dienoyl-CoA reductase/sulfur reductase-like enzyme